MDNIVLICCDCGTEKFGDSVKAIAKKNAWTHVMKGKWRCRDCQDFMDKMNKGNENGTKVFNNKH